MRSLTSGLLFVVALCLNVVHDTNAAEPKKDDMQAELDKLQGLWQTSPGGMEHRDGQQVVRNPVLEGPCFFIRGNRLIWLDDEGKPNGKEEKIELDVKSDPKRITRTPIAAKKDEPRLQGIYSATDSSLIAHFGLEGGPAPKRFLELNAAVKGLDGEEWLVHRKKLKGD
jgi:uncharacterized protein (TIGR03067 family)